MNNLIEMFIYFYCCQSCVIGMTDKVAVLYTPSHVYKEMMYIVSLFHFGRLSVFLFENLGKQVDTEPLSSLCLTFSDSCLVNVTT